MMQNIDDIITKCLIINAETLPTLAQIQMTKQNEEAKLIEFQAELVQL